MKRKPPIPVVVLLVVAIAAGGWWWWRSRQERAPDDVLRASGTVESTEARLGFETGGRLLAVGPHEGDAVTAGAAQAGPTGQPAQPGQPTATSSTPGLDQFTIDLTASARAGKIDPVVGRDTEIRQVVDILTRRGPGQQIAIGRARLLDDIRPTEHAVRQSRQLRAQCGYVHRWSQVLVHRPEPTVALSGDEQKAVQDALVREHLG